VCGRFTVKMTWAEIVGSIDSRSTGCRRLKRQGNAARSRPDRDCRYVIFCNHASVAKRLPNKDLRTREHLTEAEVERLSEATKDNRYGHRDATMILVAYRHGLWAAELVELREITEKVLPNLTAEDLKDLGISIVCHRRVEKVQSLEAERENASPEVTVIEHRCGAVAPRVYRQGC